MARKRPPSPPLSPPSKRYLNAALAAELQSLRISSPSPQKPLVQSAFGGDAASPFLSESPPSPWSYPSGVAFGDDFAESLVQPADVPVVTSPELEPHAMAISSDDSKFYYRSPDDDLVIEECDDSDQEISDASDTEGRLIVYRPPVNASPQSIASLHARLPDGRFLLRNPRTDEWIITETQNERMKRKLALVPWTGGAKRTLYERAAAPSKVIPMPWHDTVSISGKHSTGDERCETADAEQIMEIDEHDDR